MNADRKNEEFERSGWFGRFIYMPGWIDLKVGAFEWKNLDHESRVPLFGLFCVGCGIVWVSLFGLILGFGHG